MDQTSERFDPAAIEVFVGIDMAKGDHYAQAISVTDDGPGFDPEVLPRVFERYGRGDEKGSHGLGMSIVRTIVDAHRGRCEAVNLDTGGAAVRLRLPLAG